MKDKISHIVFLTPGFVISESDSTTIPALQVYLKGLAQALPDAKMTMLSFQFPFSEKSYSWNGIEVIPLNGKNKKYKKLLVWKKALNFLKKIHTKKNITVIHSFWIGECSLIGSHFSKRYNIIHVNTVMGQDAKYSNKYAKYLKNKKTKIITLSKNNEALLYKNHKLSSTIIPWGVDVDSFGELQKNVIDILGVGSLNKIKNYSTFIKIVNDLVNFFPNLNVEIIGEGAIRTQLEKEIENLNLTENITLIGKLQRNQVLNKMSKSSVLLHTSTYESFGFVFLEALYSGMRLVSFNVGLARAIPEWRICNTEKELIEACKVFLTESIQEKKRVCLVKENNCISSYLKLYYE